MNGLSHKLDKRKKNMVKCVLFRKRSFEGLPESVRAPATADATVHIKNYLFWCVTFLSNVADETNQSDGKRLPQGQYVSAAAKGSAIVGT
jgi:hypothetical protein